MIRKVLIANRGEIAVRIARTLREMGIATVAVYSDADRASLHVRVADEAYSIGPAPAAQSYLNIERILDVAKRANADAIHPGYGFLSENPALAEACVKAGVIFIGPSASAMRTMGSKTSAREHMAQAGVPIVPGAHCCNLEEAQAAADTLGYPVMLKASAGGGGKGMRLVADAHEMESAWERARSEAKSAFGDETVYLEKAILNPRHVEIQILADSHCNVVHLYERDCSIQRRHQKVIEETPCPVATPELIRRMGEVAVRGAQSVGYTSAGTFEFLLAPDGNFYFLEMNTRLQVEHPITEWITGIDLIRAMVNIADGERLPFLQHDITRRGAAIECRIYAEDPASNFLPSPGVIRELRTPGGPFVRDDSGAYEGCTISSFYDPLVSKLSVWAQTREQAIQRMGRALSEYTITGIRTNITFHQAIVMHEEFRQGTYDTGFLERNREALLRPRPLAESDRVPFAIAAAVAAFQRDEQGKGRRGHEDGGEPVPQEGSTPRLSPWAALHRARALGI